MPRRLAHFSDPRLDAQIGELIKHSNATRDAADSHASRRDNPHKVTAEQVGAPSAEEVQAKVDTHAAATTGVHGVGASEVESKAGAQAKADRKFISVNTGSVDWNTLTTPGTNILNRGEALNGPGPAIYFHCVVWRYTATRLTQLAIPYASQVPLGSIYMRGLYDDVWTSWQKFWHAGNDGVGSGLDADMLDGYHASYFQPASDERLKADIQPLAGALAKVLSLRGVSFVWNNKAREVSANRQTMAGREIGFLAGEVAQVVPEVVLDWVETPDGVTYKTVDSARLVALLVEAIKELNAKVEVLQARVAALEGSTP